MSDNRPNIILITTDQHRADCLGIQGHPVLQTPHLDWLGASGVRFSRAYSACPVCVPARRTLITGRKPYRQGVVMNAKADLPFPTIASELAAADYQTHLVGKGHFGPAPTDIGFQSAQWADSPRAGNQPGADDYQRWLIKQGMDSPRLSDAHGISSNTYITRPFHLDERFHFSNWCTDQAIDFIDRGWNRDKPFFMMLNYLHPHPPLTPPQCYYDRYMQMDLPEPHVADWARVFDGPQLGMPPEPWRVSFTPQVLRQLRAAYYASINHLDDQIGRLLNNVRPANTIILFTSDHGEMLGDHQWLRKRQPFEASIRVPMIVHGPTRMKLAAGQQRQEPVELMDIAPTILELAGVTIPQGMDGRSMLPLLQNSTPSQNWREYLHGECSEVPTTNSGMQYVTDGQWKYIWWPGQGQEQFFDVKNDPHEMHDLATTPQAEKLMAPWRQKLIHELTDRPEGFVKDGKLVKLPGPTANCVPVQ